MTETATARDAVTAAATLVDTLDRLAPDDMTAEECVAVVALLTKGPEAVTVVAKATIDLMKLRLADLVPPRTAMPIGGHTVRSKPGAKKRSEWDSDGLLRTVLDSRRFDPSTGVLIEETAADKLMHVFGLSGSAAKLTALKERGIDPDEFCHVEREATVEVI